jgi:hypothetical protein
LSGEGGALTECEVLSTWALEMKDATGNVTFFNALPGSGFIVLSQSGTLGGGSPYLSAKAARPD